VCLLHGRELGLDGLHEAGVYLERPGQHVGGRRRRGAEEGLGDGLRARQLAVEGRDDRGGGAAVVPLVVDEAAREDEDLAPAYGAGEEPVGGGDEPHVEGALEDEDDLCGARVRVRRVHAPGREVDPRHGDAQGVDPREPLHVRRSHRRPRRVAGVAGARQQAGEEVVGRHVLRPLAREPVQPQSCVRPAGQFDTRAYIKHILQFIHVYGSIDHTRMQGIYTMSLLGIYVYSSSCW
jgi:hypothetical protein